MHFSRFARSAHNNIMQCRTVRPSTLLPFYALLSLSSPFACAVCVVRFLIARVECVYIRVIRTVNLEFSPVRCVIYRCVYVAGFC